MNQFLLALRLTLVDSALRDKVSEAREWMYGRGTYFDALIAFGTHCVDVRVYSCRTFRYMEFFLLGLYKSMRGMMLLNAARLRCVVDNG